MSFHILRKLAAPTGVALLVLSGCDSEKSAPGDDDGGVLGNRCIPTYQENAKTRSFTLSFAGLTSDEGMNLDGINNGPVGDDRGMGATVAGCGHEDLALGFDSEFGSFADEVDDLLSFRSGFDGGTSASEPTLTLRMTDYDGSPSGTDLCVGGILSASTSSGEAPIQATGTIFDHVALWSFERPFSLSVPIAVDSGTCGESACEEDLTLTMVVVALSATLTPDHTSFEGHGLLTGYFVLDPAEAGTSTPDLESTIASFAPQAGLSPSDVDAVLNSLGERADLRIDDGEMSECTATRTSNAVSVAVRLVSK